MFVIKLMRYKNYLSKIKKVKSLLIKFDAKGWDNEFISGVLKRIENSIKLGEPLRLLLFTCSVINDAQLFSKKSWLYVRLSTIGNNLEPDLPRLNKIIAELKQTYPVEITVLIGNTDPYYIYLQQFKNFSESDTNILWERFSERWAKYRKLLEKNLSKKLKGCPVKFLSWYDFEKKIESKYGISFEKEYENVMNNLRQYFSKRDLDFEFRLLRKQFGPGKYFENLSRPSDKLLKNWVERKFTEYAVQGKWIYKYFPNAILMQNEKPSELRSRMYQPLIKEKYNDYLPIVYFFGVDDSGFR